MTPLNNLNFKLLKNLKKLFLEFLNFKFKKIIFENVKKKLMIKILKKDKKKLSVTPIQ